ncbi:MAG TPA: aldehyde ferredoxin oxidoreductase family protein [Ardenticatenaceae bacterium]|nr:aldehyde ferredoxin oxidoreductase family protein [Ardenticatenaceae bacterium]
MPFGYHGRILRVNLTTGDLEIETPDESFYREYMGGGALGLYYLLKEMPAGVDPLGPDNMMVVSLSVLTGAAISGQSRMTINAKSPLTGTIGDSQAGGFWPAEMKRAGFDAIVVKGASPTPVYLWLHDGAAELRDASHLWGKVTGEAEALIRAELGDPKIEVAQIGPAGENLVRFAAVINMSNRANGRTGMGAVMGSKKLKAIAVRGRQAPTVAHPDRLKALHKLGMPNYNSNPDMESLGVYGTAGVVLPQQWAGGLPTHNYVTGVFDGAEAISGERMAETILKERDTCYACVVRCKRVVEVDAPSNGASGKAKAGNGLKYVDAKYGGPEYETVATFGSYCGVDDLAAIAKANEICNAYGMDTISCGATVAFAFECFERGTLTAADAGGLELTWGNAAAMVALTEQIARREGLGAILAEGSQRAAQTIGRGAERYVVAVKGSEVPAHMPHVKASMGLIYAVNPYGADHQASEHDPYYEAGAGKLYHERLAEIGLTDYTPSEVMDANKVRYTLVTQHAFSILDTLNLCQFDWGPAWQLYGMGPTVEVVRAVTGWEDVSLDELMRLGAKRVTMLRAFNSREGFDRRHDTLPRRIVEEALIGGPNEGAIFSQATLDAALDTYYHYAGWDVETGNPTRATLEDFNLGWVADQLGI